MKQVINIAIFGLSLDIANQLKTCIEKLIPTTHTVQWVNIASQQLDVLLVSDSFFNANTIQSIIKNKSCKYLRLVKDLHKSGELENGTLFYPFSESSDLMQWMAQEFPVAGQTSHVQASVSPQTNTTSNTSNALPAATLKVVVSELLNQRNGFVKIFDDLGEIGVVDTRTERLWLNPERSYTKVTPTFNQSYAKGSVASQAQHNYKVVDLKVWLWQLIFNSSRVEFADIKESACFKLKTWPQFMKRAERRELLKVSACFARGAKVQHVLEHIQINKNQLNQFLFTAQLLNMCEPITVEQIQFSKNSVMPETQESGVFGGFLSKLRKKLGI